MLWRAAKEGEQENFVHTETAAVNCRFKEGLPVAIPKMSPVWRSPKF